MRGSEWEREASLSIFENGKMTIDQNVGIRLKGYSSRDSPQKSFHVFARKKYGKKKLKVQLYFLIIQIFMEIQLLNMIQYL